MGPKAKTKAELLDALIVARAALNQERNSRIGLIAEVDEERAIAKKAEAERDALTARVAELTTVKENRGMSVNDGRVKCPTCGDYVDGSVIKFLAPLKAENAELRSALTETAAASRAFVDSIESDLKPDDPRWKMIDRACKANTEAERLNAEKAKGATR